MTIRILPPTLINQIAAGEVIERPSSVIKELVENALDAGADRIHVTVEDAGKNLIRVVDNGCGMAAEDLALCVERHATSKLSDHNLFDIKSMGFRGEALPSIGSISRLTIESHDGQEETGWSLRVEGGALSPLKPTAMERGTRVEVRDLFFATPARLNFMRTNATEMNHIVGLVQNIALAHPDKSFYLFDGAREVLAFDRQMSLADRLNKVFGAQFSNNALYLETVFEDMHLSGYVSLPTFHKASSQNQLFYVNGRLIKEKMMVPLLRAAYHDLIAKDRYPLVCLFLKMDGSKVDVNVHPAKLEVRFSEPDRIRSFLITSLKNTLRENAQKAAPAVSEEILKAFRPSYPSPPSSPSFSSGLEAKPSFSTVATLREPSRPGVKYVSSYASRPSEAVTKGLFESGALLPEKKDLGADNQEENDPVKNFPLGAACAQIHGTYIISQTNDGFVVVDQHAAHERLVYESYKQNVLQKKVERQGLLIPEVVPIEARKLEIIAPHLPELEDLGLVVEAFGFDALLVREIPALLGRGSVQELVETLVEEIYSCGKSFSLQERLHEVCSGIACRGSVRAGRALSLREMNDLLRTMEKTLFSGQCNHGRPTYVKLALKDIEKLFGRS